MKEKNKTKEHCTVQDSVPRPRSEKELCFSELALSESMSCTLSPHVSRLIDFIAISS